MFNSKRSRDGRVLYKTLIQYASALHLCQISQEFKFSLVTTDTTTLPRTYEYTLPEKNRFSIPLCSHDKRKLRSSTLTHSSVSERFIDMNKLVNLL